MSAFDYRELGLAPLSMLSTPPPQLVREAAAAGFDSVGLRVRAVTEQEPSYDLSPGSPLLAETLEALRETGLRVEDIEFLLLDGTDQRDAWMRMLEAGQALSAGTLTVACADPDLTSATTTMGRLVADAEPYGILPSIEPITYQQIHSLPSALAMARETGCGVVLDSLHLARFGADDDEIMASLEHVSTLQLCDAPRRGPETREDLIREARGGRLAPGDGDLDLAALVRLMPPGFPLSIEVPAGPAEPARDDWAGHLHRRALELLAAVEQTDSSQHAPTTDDSPSTWSENHG